MDKNHRCLGCSFLFKNILHESAQRVGDQRYLWDLAVGDAVPLVVDDGVLPDPETAA